MVKKKQNAKTVAPKTVVSKTVKHAKIFVLIAVVILVAGIWLIMRNRLVTNPHQKALLSMIEQLNLGGMEPQVVSKIETLREEVKRNPNSGDPWGKLAMNLDAHDLQKESIPLYQEASALSPSDFRWPYFCAVILSQSGSDASLDWFQRASQIKPDYVPLIIRYGDALFQSGKIDQSIEKYQQALKYDPASAHAFFGLAQISFSRSDMATARSNLQKAFGADPSFGEAYNLLASTCRRMNDANCAQQASAAAKDLPEKTPLQDPVYEQVGAEGESSLWHRARGSEFMKQKSYESAIAEFQKATEIRSDIQTHEDLAQALSAAGRLNEAAEQYQMIVKQHPTARNYFGLGLAYARMGSFDRAEEFFRKAIEEKSDFAEARFNLAVVDAKTGRLQETIENLKEAVRINPDYTEAHYHLALAYLAARDPKAAEAEYQTVMKQNQKIGKQLERLIEQSKTSNISTE